MEIVISIKDKGTIALNDEKKDEREAAKIKLND